jgi:hypothetical protein
VPDVVAQLLILHAAAASSRGGHASTIRHLEARYTEYLSWLAEELSDIAATHEWLAVTVQLGCEADDPRVEQYAAIRRSAAALRADDPAEAVVHARRALSDRGLSPRLRLIALKCQSRAHAQQGDQAACHRALGLRRALLNDQARAAPNEEWEWGPPSDSLLESSGLDEATMLMELGDYRPAAELFAVAVPAAFPDEKNLSPRMRNARVRFAIREATAYAYARECDLAAEVIETFLPAIAPASSAVVGQDLRRLASILARRRTARLRALAPDIATLARTKRPKARVRRLEAARA